MSRLSVVELVILSLVFLTIYSNSSAAASNLLMDADTVTRCDQLAAHPADPQKIIAGTDGETEDPGLSCHGRPIADRS